MVINDIQIPYPELRIVAQPKLHYSVENAKIGLTLNRIYERFDAICHFHYVSERFFFLFLILNSISNDWCLFSASW